MIDYKKLYLQTLVSGLVGGQVYKDGILSGSVSLYNVLNFYEPEDYGHEERIKLEAVLVEKNDKITVELELVDGYDSSVVFRGVFNADEGDKIKNFIEKIRKNLFWGTENRYGHSINSLLENALYRNEFSPNFGYPELRTIQNYAKKSHNLFINSDIIDYISGYNISLYKMEKTQNLEEILEEFHLSFERKNNIAETRRLVAVLHDSNKIFTEEKLLKEHIQEKQKTDFKM